MNPTTAALPVLPHSVSKSDAILETDVKDGISCGKVKGCLNVDFQVSGLTKREVGFIKLICGLIICEMFHNVPVPNEYLASLVSELYKRFKRGQVTYAPGLRGNLLWGKTQLKWMTGSCVTPIPFLNLHSELTHAFPMAASLDTIVHVKFNASLQTKSYLNSEAITLQDAGFSYVETFFRRLECRDEALFVLHVRKNVAIFNFNSVLQMYSDLPSQLVGKSEQSFQTWDITPIKLYRRANFVERLMSPSSQQKALQLYTANLNQESVVKFPWK